MEKITIDAIYLKALPLDELDEAMEATDPDMLREYSKLTKNKRVVKTVNKLLENRLRELRGKRK